MAAAPGRDTLPDPWSYGVCGDGRVFFINDKTRTTTWLHPRTGEPVNSGHMIRSDLPRGWEEGFTAEGASYFINHNEKTTVFRHPVTGQISPENTDFVVLPPEQRTPSMVSESSTAVASSTVDATSGSKSSKPSGKIHSFGKRDHAIQRNPNMAVVVRGWLYKQDSSGMRLWKRKWFVLSDFCLFYYKDSREEVVLSSIPLPSYVIAPVEPEDHISRKYAFKAEHGGMRTYYFSADTQEDMNGWIRAMNQAALMQSHSLKSCGHVAFKPLNVEKQAVPQTNHIISSRKGSAQAEGLHQSGWEEVPGGEPKQGREAEMRHGCSKELPEVQVSFPGDTDADLLPPEAGAPSRTSSGPHAQRNGLHADQNDSVVYKRGLVPRTDTEKEVQRKTALAQVEKWVKVQKGEVKRSVDVSRASAEYTLPRRTPPMQPMPGMMEAYQSLPKPVRRPSGGSPPTARNMPSDYKYAQDRLSHFRMSMDERLANREGTVWQLYEWQQRQAFRHGSPTAPMFTATDSTDTAAFRVMLEVPRSVSVPPSPCDLPLPGGPCRLLSPRRPHTPADRVTVRPLDEARGVDVVSVSLPSQTAQTERRSMPSMGYITHTVSAPSLHGKTADDTYMHLKKDLEYLDLKVTGRDLLKDRPPRPFRIAESDVDVKLSRLCEQDKILQDLETRIHTLKVDKDKLESVLEVSRQQMEQYRDQPAHMEKIAYQQRLLQEDVVHIRADISQASTEMENAWSEYSQLECDVDRLRYALHEQMKRGGVSQERSQLRKDLWQIEDVMAGLSTSKADYRLTVESVQNPGERAALSVPDPRKLVPSASSPPVPSLSVGELKGAWLSPVQLLPHPSHLSHTPQKPEWVDEDAPPRPPLPHLYSPEEQPPEVPPLPRETSVIRHMSVRGLKRQSDERKRDREIGQYTNGDNRVELRTFLSEPELAIVGGPSGHDGGYQTLPSRARQIIQPDLQIDGLVMERPKSALERLYPGEPAPTRGRMSAEEQLERMKRHQRALVRERKRTLSQSERQAASSRAASSSLERPRSRSDEWLTSRSSPLHQLDLEPLDYQLDLSKELATPQKVTIPERYVDWESEELPSPQEMEARQRKAERIKSILAKSSLPVSVVLPSDLDFTLQEQERMITMSYALASEASLKSKQVTAEPSSEGPSPTPRRRFVPSTPA
uniref:Pleckstrin homology domain containing, family A member 7b n=1 Tax=Electrophorus electricus TaxID=8005 RepID=A0A4W4GZN4_ELEEL